MATTAQAVQPQNGSAELRRLKPAAEAAAKAGALGEQALQMALERAPASVKPALERAVETAAPYVHKATDGGAGTGAEGPTNPSWPRRRAVASAVLSPGARGKLPVTRWPLGMPESHRPPGPSLGLAHATNVQGGAGRRCRAAAVGRALICLSPV